ncbi:hypothetical protein DSO57_1006242 [Entomophthora muscae]|uniref:Uncharacterized protein n=1 Tax=Entomophthora muscae TaxID=34485 RepID=A0ACC2TVS4_9FUNG|nr:hypothetical protein DSO57_1006242 [Entomophthora muscae]
MWTKDLTIPHSITGRQPAGPTARLPAFFWDRVKNKFDHGETSETYLGGAFMIKLCHLRDPLGLANRSTNLSNTPLITQATTNGVLYEFFQEQGLPNDNKYHVSKKEIKIPRSSPSNDESSILYATKVF